MKVIIPILLACKILNINGQEYLPIDEFKRECFEIIEVDELYHEAYEESLKRFKAPSIYKNQISDNVVRFLCLRSFHSDVLITLHFSNTPRIEVLMGTFLDVNGDGYIGDFIDASSLSRRKREILYSMLEKDASASEVTERFGKTIFIEETPEFKIKEFKPNLSENDIIPVLEMIEQLHDESSMEPCQHIDDGSYWLFEFNNPQYKLIARQSPSNNLVYDLGELLWKVASLEDEKLY